MAHGSAAAFADKSTYDEVRMAIKSSDDLLFFAEGGAVFNPNLLTNELIVGLYKAASYGELNHFDLLLAEYDSRPRKWYWPFKGRVPCLDSMPQSADFEFVAGAKIALGSDGVIQIINVGAMDGYGPTLYATVLELAAAINFAGAAPTTRQGHITDRAANIWEQFLVRPCYQGKIVTKERKGSMHAEYALTRVYTVRAGGSLTNLDAMRARDERYREFWCAEADTGSTRTNDARFRWAANNLAALSTSSAR